MAKAKKADAKEAKALGVAPAAVQAKAPSMDDLLGDAIAATPSNKKNGTPDIRLSGEQVEQAINDYVQALSDKKDAEATLADCSAIIAPEANRQRIELSQRFKSYVSSLRINGRLTFVGSSQYCKMKFPDCQPQHDGLQTLFGATLFARYFSTGYALKVKSEAISPELVGALKEACAKVGKNFAEVFDTEKVVACHESLHRDRIVVPEVVCLMDKAEKDGLIKPYKATIKE